jgi:tetratricopeptide (TPR) repeat protein
MLAGCFSNMGCVYKREEKALKIRKKCRHVDHPELGDSYNNIANIHKHLDQYTQAIRYYKRSLKICQKTLPPQHCDTAMRLENIDRTYFAIGELQEALLYLKQASTIYCQMLPVDHPYIVETEQAIRYVSSRKS